MKICIWLGTISDIGGVQRLCTLLANELVKENEVTIASFKKRQIFRKNRFS